MSHFPILLFVYEQNMYLRRTNLS